MLQDEQSRHKCMDAFGFQPQNEVTGFLFAAAKERTKTVELLGGHAAAIVRDSAIMPRQFERGACRTADADEQRPRGKRAVTDVDGFRNFLPQTLQRAVTRQDLLDTAAVQAQRIGKLAKSTGVPSSNVTISVLAPPMSRNAPPVRCSSCIAPM